MYYDGTKLLSMKDIDGNQPEIYMVTTNRTGGKTTWFSRKLVNGFLKKGIKFGLLYRFVDEMEDISEKFFKDIGSLFFPEMEMTDKPMGNGKFRRLMLNDQHCGYALPLNAAEAIKKNSHLFSDIGCLFMDEFQSETYHYVPREIDKFQSVHKSIARGQGKQHRYVPVYMCSNPVTLLNPYYTAMGISDRLRTDTKFLRGPGYVLEQGYNESAAKAQADSGFSKAFAGTAYNNYASEGSYLDDNLTFIEKPSGRGRYEMTIVYQGEFYSVVSYDQLGIVYVSDSYNENYPFRISLTTEDHRINYVMLQNQNPIISKLRKLFEYGCFRFKNLKCKAMTIAMLSY